MPLASPLLYVSRIYVGCLILIVADICANNEEMIDRNKRHEIKTEFNVLWTEFFPNKKIIQHLNTLSLIKKYNFKMLIIKIIIFICK